MIVGMLSAGSLGASYNVIRSKHETKTFDPLLLSENLTWKKAFVMKLRHLSQVLFNF